VPELTSNVANTSPDSIYHRVMGLIEKFLAADYAWQSGTIIVEDTAEDTAAEVEADE